MMIVIKLHYCRGTTMIPSNSFTIFRKPHSLNFQFHSLEFQMISWLKRDLQSTSLLRRTHSLTQISLIMLPLRHWRARQQRMNRNWIQIERKSEINSISLKPFFNKTSRPVMKPLQRNNSTGNIAVVNVYSQHLNSINCCFYVSTEERAVE